MAVVRFFAGVAEAAGTATATLGAASIGDLRSLLGERHSAGFSLILSRCSLLVNGIRAADDEVPLSAMDTIDVLPPFAGG